MVNGSKLHGEERSKKALNLRSDEKLRKVAHSIIYNIIVIHGSQVYYRNLMGKEERRLVIYI
ncbi:hypothetical protein Nepgr_009804 [Nepenthes gracilis]|uniref:Uncharacterized protein n=1 Tax=Nepenthes gracilis TaxID=150966 RepID=A0AAD3XKP5_NEPGR|nr:hypothetical protein Nepgr_009804 [Nepenthes gracilis]